MPKLSPGKKPPTSRPEILQVVPLSAPVQTKTRRGRPKKLQMPPLPQEIFEGMTELEKAHYEFFVEAFLEDIPQPSQMEIFCLRMAGLDYINFLRLQVSQLKTGELVTMSRQHPGAQLRAWIDQALRKRKMGGRELTAEQEERLNMKSALLGLSSS